MDETRYNFQVNLGGMLDVLSNHLYKSPDVFLRELLQNGVDAITLRKKLDPTWNLGEIRIGVTPGRFIVFRDNGIGLNEQDIHRFLSVVGQSSKSELESGYVSDDYIGRFGIGLLSCFMVSDSITIRTRRVDSEQGYEWVGYADGTYKLTPSDDVEIGTMVILAAKAGVGRYYQPGKLEHLARYYGMMLPIPIYMDDELERINELPIDFNHAGREQLLSFGNWVFEDDFLDAIPINTRHLKGVAFVVPYRTSQTSKLSHRIFLKNMLLTTSADNLLPEWAFFLRCFLNTEGLRPVASREDFYEDKQLEAAYREFSDAIRNYLRGLAYTNPDLLRSIVDVHTEAIKSMAVWDDELFGIFIDYLLFETSEGLMTGAALKERPDAVYVSSVSKFKQMKPVYLSQDKLLICTGYASDNSLIEKLAEAFDLRYEPLRDDGIDTVISDPSFSEWERTLALASEATEALSLFDCEVQMKSFYPEELPALYEISEGAKFFREMERAQEKGSSLFAGALESMMGQRERVTSSVLYMNLANPLIKRLIEVKDPEKLRSVTRILYIQALVAGGYPMHSLEMSTLNNELLSLLEKTL